jgi:2-keto-4-pentenoate hydratase
VDHQTRAQAAKALLTAYETGQPVAPLTTTYPDLTLDDAYAVQLLQVDALVGRGRTVEGHKVGLTSAAMQQLLGVDEPDYGHLLDDFFRGEDELIPATDFLQPRIEPEIGFVLRAALKGPGVTLEEAAEAVDHVVPALEIVDSRIKDWQIGLLDTIADNASSGALVLGATRTPLEALDLASVSCTLVQNGKDVGSGKGSAVLGNPLNALVWLANTIGARGIALEAGHVVLPGAVCAMVPVVDGDTVTATFDGLGSVTARFGKEA